MKKNNMARKPVLRARAFSLIEVLFAIAMLGVGVVGILSLFTTGINAANQSGTTTTAAMEAQSLYTRVVSEMNAAGTQRQYLTAIYDPAAPTAPAPPVMDPPKNEWIHGAPISNFTGLPLLCDPDAADATLTNVGTARNDMWWVCRVSKTPMDKNDPINLPPDAVVAGPVPPTNVFPRGLYQIAIAVYRNYKTATGVRPAKPAAVFTTFVTAGY